MRATTSGSAGAEGDTSPLMPHTTRKRYAVVSCHVERPLDDEVWARFSALQQRRPGGFAIAALMRPADAAAGEDEASVARASAGGRRARPARSPHALDGSRPRAPYGRADRASACSQRAGGCASSGSHRRSSAAAVGTPTSRSPRPAPSSATWTARRATRRPPYLAPGEAWASLAEPARIRLPSGRLLAADPDDAFARRPRSRALAAAIAAGAWSTCTSTTPISPIGGGRPRCAALLRSPRTRRGACRSRRRSPRRSSRRSRPRLRGPW